MQLTDRTIRGLKPADKPYKKSDSNGLYLEVMPGGSKVWRFKFRFNGKENRLTLGRWPDMGAHDARNKVAEVRKTLSDGKNPAHIKKMEKHAARIAATNTVFAMGEDWFNKQKNKIVSGTAKNVRNILNKWLYPFVGDIPVNEINAPLVLSFVRELENKTTAGNVTKAFQAFSQIMRYSMLCGMADYNPLSGLGGILPAKNYKNLPAMPLSRLPEFFSRLEASPATWQTKGALSILPHVFVRPGELCGAVWGEFNFKSSLWCVPAERMKMKNDHIIPLSKQVIDLLQSLPTYYASKTTRFISGNNKDYLFPGRSGKGHLSLATLALCMNNLGYKGIACPHGFRAMASTTLNENGFSADAIERQLAHSEQNKVRAAYNRTEYLDERREMMQWWSDFIDGTAAPENVVKLRRRA
ncbi:TPA: tyrosine-type recombinase/integrase [Salmonella enterica]|nr:tyrosine-type recombinase/integrase [Salmonella enterica]HEA0261508.1 tyrosine-type recombinase/integrase [Salmonella enterica]HEA0265573.1 tyrosine-type recombinase/integrase [Salmonella enterica]HEA0292078.1 tyrosine-type recombinase/integrase [Salmonella enterica]HEA0303165.1 tyrosine-type recombinase/integrase [Salmonella enterica]